MTNGEKQQTSDVLQTLHGARSLPPEEAAEALKPFLESMRKSGSDDALARASIAAVTELARSLKENHAASDDLWQQAIEATVSYANEAG
jgi:truncated hemoglobin YjbI